MTVGSLLDGREPSILPLEQLSAPLVAFDHEAFIRRDDARSCLARHGTAYRISVLWTLVRLLGSPRGAGEITAAFAAAAAGRFGAPLTVLTGAVTAALCHAMV